MSGWACSEAPWRATPPPGPMAGPASSRSCRKPRHRPWQPIDLRQPVEVGRGSSRRQPAFVLFANPAAYASAGRCICSGVSAPFCSSSTRSAARSVSGRWATTSRVTFSSRSAALMACR